VKILEGTKPLFLGTVARSVCVYVCVCVCVCVCVRVYESVCMGV
jgi:hypothetical protein